MPVSRYAYSKTSRQEQFSIAYVHSVASVAGFKVVSVNVIDEDSVDIQIEQKGNEELYPFHPVLRIQAKCTYDIRQKPSSDGFLHYSLSAKNYDDLRQETGIPFILVVLCIPSEDESHWLVESEDYMSLYNVAYWMSLRGKRPLPESATEYKNRTTTVLIPVSQRFDVNGLLAIMDILADGGFPK